MTRFIPAGLIALALSVPALAGGFYVTLGNPNAHEEAKAKGAVLIAKMAGCHEPEKADLAALAIGNVNGQRKTLPLKLVRLAEPGAYALQKQWPNEGNWVIQFIGKDADRLTSTLVLARPDGIERTAAKMAPRMPAATEIDTMLNEGSKLKAAR